MVEWEHQSNLATSKGQKLPYPGLGSFFWALQEAGMAPVRGQWSIRAPCPEDPTNLTMMF